MIFNIGPLEFILILLVAIIVLGPERMVTGARTFGRWIYKLVRSPTWRAIMTTSQEIRDLPNKIVRESGIEESFKEVQSLGTDLNNEISQAVKDVNDEVSQAASAVSAEVSQAVKDVNAELKQTSQEASQAAARATLEANQVIQSAVKEQPSSAETTSDAEALEEVDAPEVTAEEAEAALPVEEIIPAEESALEQTNLPVEQPVLVLQDSSAAEPAGEPAGSSNDGHFHESVAEVQSVQGTAPEAAVATKPRKTPKARVSKAVKILPVEEEPAIQPPASPAAHIKIE